MLHHSIDEVRPWIERTWSGTDGDVFPRDKIKTWRKNPKGVDAAASVPGVTKMGHGPFTFELVSWDGLSWKMAVPDGSVWHGFELTTLGAETRITHTLEGRLGLSFRAFVLPIHDWAVESLFDRLEEALATGTVPFRTARPMGRRASAAYAVMSWLRRRAAKG